MVARLLVVRLLVARLLVVVVVVAEEWEPQLSVLASDESVPVAAAPEWDSGAAGLATLWARAERLQVQEIARSGSEGVRGARSGRSPVSGHLRRSQTVRGQPVAELAQRRSGLRQLAG